MRDFWQKASDVFFLGQGKRVVRLKGGCPSVFSRSSSEIAALAAAGVEAELVPGISSALAAPLFAGDITTTDPCHLSHLPPPAPVPTPAGVCLAELKTTALRLLRHAGFALRTTTHVASLEGCRDQSYVIP